MKYFAFILMFLPLFLFGQSTRLPDALVSGSSCKLVHGGDTTYMDCLYILQYKDGLDVSLSIRFFEDKDIELIEAAGISDFLSKVDFACYKNKNREIEICLMNGDFVHIGKGESWSWKWAIIKDGSTTLVLF